MNNQKQVSIIFPVYNEKDTIETILKDWKNHLDRLPISYQFIICEDGSKDGTNELLQKIQADYDLLINSKKERRGYGGAVIDGILSAQTKFIFCVDSDGQYDPADFQKFWDNRDKADIIFGWRVKRMDAISRRVFSSLFRFICKTLFPCALHDPSAVASLFRKSLILPNISYLYYLKEGFWYGFVGMAVKKQLSFYEIPINHRKRLKGDTQVYKPKKIPGIALRNLIGLIKLKLAK